MGFWDDGLLTRLLRRVGLAGPDDAGRAEAALRHAADLLDEGRAGEALPYAEQAVALAPDWPSAYQVRGAARRLTGDRKGAFADFSSAIEFDRSNAVAIVWRAVTRFETGDLPGALADGSAAVRAAPENPDGYRARASFHFAANDFDAALADCSRAIELDPSLAFSYLQRAQALWAKGERAAAYDDWDFAVEIDPDDPLPRTSRGRARLEDGDLAGALADFDAALAIAPRDATVLGLRGLTRVRMGDLAGADADFSAGIEADPAVSANRHDRAVLRKERGDYEGAAADFAAGIDRDPFNGEWHCARAECLLAAGRWREAAESGRAALKLWGWRSPNSVYAALCIHFGELRAGNPEAAGALLDEAAARADPQAWPYPVLRFLRRELSESALLEQATDDGRQTEARTYIGLALLSSDPARARDRLQWVRDHGRKTFNEYAYAVSELARL